MDIFFAQVFQLNNFIISSNRSYKNVFACMLARNYSSKHLPFLYMVVKYNVKSINQKVN